MYRRVLILFSIIMFMFGATFLCLDSVSTKDKFKNAALSQQSYKLKISDVRATIYDCRNIPLVNLNKKYIAAVIPSTESLTALNPVVENSKKEELYQKCLLNTPFTIEVQKKVKSPYIKIFEIPIRYSSITLAPHIIGYISSDKKGVCGIEKSFDKYLSDKEKNISIKYDIDACGKILPGGNINIDDKSYFTTKGICLNLDSRIQAISQETASKYMQRGAVVVTQVPNCEIRASVSIPLFSPKNVAQYLNDKNSPLLDRTLCAFNLGSIFKLVTCAAALKRGISENFVYNCEGKNEVEDASFKCFNGKSHGEINMQQAVAYSCNGYFIELTKKYVNRKMLLDMSTKFGLGKKIEFSENIISKEGKLPSYESLENPKTLANFSFGQGKLLATPIQISALINSIASEGYYTKPKLIKNYLSENMQPFKDNTFKSFEVKERILPSKIANKLKEFMKASATYGTSIKGKPENVEIAAKTSTAQTGIIEDGKKVEQSWFAGFFPYENPKYCIVVLSEAGAGGGESAGPIFKEIVERMYKECPEVFIN